jgi:hypothetical protein
MGGHRQVRLAQHYPGHRERIDRVGLASLPRRPACAGHQLGRHPHHRLARVEQVDLQARREVTAVLNPPDQVRTELDLGPPDRLVVTLPVGLHGQLAKLPADLVDRDERVRPLVYVGTDNDHGGRLLHW